MTSLAVHRFAKYVPNITIALELDTYLGTYLHSTVLHMFWYWYCFRLETILATYTTVNDFIPNEFALVRLGKKVMWEVSHKVSS